MKDQTLLKLITETIAVMEEMPPDSSVELLIGPYDAIVHDARENHPAVAFLQACRPYKEVGTMEKFELQLLFTQLRIVLEALQEEKQPPKAP